MTASRRIVALAAMTVLAGPLAIAQNVASEADSTDTVLFVCEHGSVKSMLAATLFERAAAREGLSVRSVSRGTAPDAAIPRWLRSAMEADDLEVGERRPLPLSDADLMSATRVIVFDVSLPPTVPAETAVERWDGLPSVSKDYRLAREAIAARVEDLVGRLQAR